MVDDHPIVILWFACCFSVFAPSVPNSPITGQFFIPELHAQEGIDDVSMEASGPCLCHCKFTLIFCMNTIYVC